MAQGEAAELARAKWHASGLLDTHAKILKFRGLDPTDLLKLGCNFQSVPALFLPYFDITGATTKFYRLRYLAQPKGFALAKPQRYAQAPGTLNEVYFPPLVKWAEIAKNTDTPLHITEGELKAAAACAASIPTLGLGGVDVWQAKKRGIDFLPGLQAINWNRRKVTIVYDSDAATNTNVVRAQRDIARALTAKGAFVRVASLPPAATGEKQGVDDYLVVHGAASLSELLEQAAPFAEGEALWALNEEIVYIRDPGVIVVREKGQIIVPQSFVSHAYANRMHLEEVTDKEGNVKRKKVKTAQKWLEWESRFELQKIEYAPGQPPVFDDQWNNWRGWGCEPKKGNTKPWIDLLDHVFKDNKEARQWFERWCAYPLQHPGTKLFTNVLIWGTHHGTGKTLIGYTLRNIYGDNAIEIGDEELQKSFNHWAKNKQFVIGEEITGSDKRHDANKLKRMVTREYIDIDTKHQPVYTIRDCINYYLTSNHPDTLFMDDTDRRCFVFEIIGGPLSLEFYKMYDAWVKSDGPAALFYHLLNVDLGDFNPTAPAMATHSKTQMINDNKSELGAWVLGLREDTEAALRVLGDSVSQKAELVSSPNILRCYDPTGEGKVTANGLGRELKRAGFRQVNNGTPLRTVHGLQRLWIIRNHDKWMKSWPKEIVAHYNAVFTGGGKF